MKFLPSFCFSLCLIFFFGFYSPAPGFSFSSSAFKNNTFIPPQYTSDGKDISPPLQWTDVPSGTKSFALICDDPDAPNGTWTHWILFNIPADVSSFSEGQLIFPLQVIIGKNSSNKHGYKGPNPPPGKLHHYHFKLYALDTLLPSNQDIKRQELDTLIKPHVLGKATLIGLYKK